MAIPDPGALNLWPQQRQALSVSQSYFSAASPRCALIDIPTGTGKTGVMATIAALRTPAKPVLVVCPSAALVHQLEDDFKGAFWSKIGAPIATWAPEQTFQLLPSNAATVPTQLGKSAGKRTVVFSTIQTLQQIYASSEYGALKGQFGTVLFDEGHREPAPQWARAARGLGAPTILFSATPFRNDLKVFDVDLAHVAFVSFKEATTKNWIRNVSIREAVIGRSATDFVREAISFRDNLIKSNHFSAQCKMIVRAGDAEAVDELFGAFRKALKQRPEKALAVHNTFQDEMIDGHVRRSDVPNDLRKRHEAFLLHQFMLTEGVDDPNCTMLALFDPFGTERQLVQQVGRILRHDGTLGTPTKDAVVLCRQGDEVPQMWTRFLAFDDACVRNNNRPPVRNDKEVLERLVKALPDVDYVSKKFRARIDLETADLEQDLQIPKSAVVFSVSAKFSLADFKQEVTQALSEEDRYETRILDIGTDCHLHLSLRLVQSPFLSESLFLSPSLEVTVYAKHGSRLFFYDSAGLWIDDAGEMNRAGPIAMRSLLPEQTDTRITTITLKNSDLGPLSIKSRSMAARSLALSGTFMGEHLHVVSNASGRVGANRRAVAFIRSRVRDGSGHTSTPEEFRLWTRAVSRELGKGSRGADLFHRFATPAATPSTTDPDNILIDVEELIDEFVDENRKGIEFDLDSVCADIAPRKGPKGFSHQFTLTINGAAKTVWIKWDSKRRKYWLRSDHLSEFKHRENDRISLTRRLNQRQPFRIVVSGSPHVYSYGHFYDIDLDLNKAGGVGPLILSLTTGLAHLNATKVRSEKGSFTGIAQSWPMDSLFGLIDHAFSSASSPRIFGPRFPIFLCDDFGPEAADFIGVEPSSTTGPPRVVLIAAKWKKGAAGVSAQNIYDVCGQVTKNVAHIKSDSQSLPGNPTKWNQVWKHDGGRVKRIRSGPDASTIRTQLVAARRSPHCERAIWLVLGGGILSRKALESELRQAKPKAHVLQFAHLVLATYASCQSVGAGMRIYCSE